MIAFRDLKVQFNRLARQLVVVVRRWPAASLVVLAGLVAAATFVAAWQTAHHSGPATGGSRQGTAAESSLASDQAAKLRAAKIISSFENSTTDIQYGYAENIGDGRGITAGRAGFTSGTHDLLLVVQHYTNQQPDNPLAKYLPALSQVDGSGSTQGLDGFTTAWKQVSKTDPAFNRVQDEVVDQLYFDPSLELAAQAGVLSQLGQLIFWDTATQHGIGKDADGLPAIIKETNKAAGKVGDKSDETTWLNKFLDIRKHHLQHAADQATRQAWKQSTSRVDALRSLLHQNKLQLQPPLQWNVYGDSFKLNG